MASYVYKYVYQDKIIYIGKTDTSLIRRLKQHGKNGDNIDSKYWDEINKSDIYYCYAANKIMSDVIESELIRRYKPVCNKAKKSNWSGIEFKEPVWYFFDKNIINELKKTKIIYKTSKKEQELKQKEQELKQREYRLNFKELSKKYNLECEIKEMKGEIEDLKKYKKLFDARATQVKEICAKKNLEGIVYDAESIYKNYLTYSEIIDLYRCSERVINYISTAFNEEQKLICKKIIYTDEFDELRYEFQNSYKDRKNGDIIYKKGIIYKSRNDITYTYKDTYKILRFWDRIGNAFYREI